MDWSELRHLIPAAKTWAFFDHAGISPLPSPAADVLREYADDFSHRGSLAIKRWVDQSQGVRGQVARFIGASPGEIAFVKNTGEALMLVAEGYPWKSGDEVVFATDEYPSNQYVWMNLASRGVRPVAVRPKGRWCTADDLIAACTSATKLIAVSFVGFATGARVDLATLSEYCRPRRIHLCVDAIQGLTALPFDVGVLPIDFAACGAHKWLMAAQGAGFLYVRQELIEMLRPIGVGAMSVVKPSFDVANFQLKPDAGRWEGGTMNFGGIAALGASLKLWERLKPSAVHNRIEWLTDYLVEAAKSAGIAVFSPREPGMKSGIVSFELSDPAEIVARCRDAGIVVNNRGGRVRAAVHCYNTVDELDRLIAVLRGA